MPAVQAVPNRRLVEHREQRVRLARDRAIVRERAGA